MGNKPDKLLFTPGPLTTSATVKSAMLRDLGSRDQGFIEKVALIRSRLLQLANVSNGKGYTSILMQGSGTFGIEAVISSAIPANGHLLVIINGVYGERISKIASLHRILQTRMVFPEDQIPDPVKVRQTLEQDATITHVAMIHCETTTGIINPTGAIGELCAAFNKVYILDAMSSFGAYPVDMEALHIDFLISSSNKCIEGVPGFSFILARMKTLMDCENQARTLTMDLYAQWKGLESDGQFRFTPPTHVLLAFAQALDELEKEGGVEGRMARYKENYELLSEGMQQLGFKEYIEPGNRGYIITCFHYPAHPDFSFRDFYSSLSEKGFVIYPGKLSQVDCFRIGNIGQIRTTDIERLLLAIRTTLGEYGIPVPLKS